MAGRGLALDTGHAHAAVAAHGVAHVGALRHQVLRGRALRAVGADGVGEFLAGLDNKAVGRAIVAHIADTVGCCRRRDALVLQVTASQRASAQLAAVAVAAECRGHALILRVWRTHGERRACTVAGGGGLLRLVLRVERASRSVQLALPVRGRGAGHRLILFLAQRDGRARDIAVWIGAARQTADDSATVIRTCGGKLTGELVARIVAAALVEIVASRAGQADALAAGDAAACALLRADTGLAQCDGARVAAHLRATGHGLALSVRGCGRLLRNILYSRCACTQRLTLAIGGGRGWLHLILLTRHTDAKERTDAIGCGRCCSKLKCRCIGCRTGWGECQALTVGRCSGLSNLIAIDSSAVGQIAACQIAQRGAHSADVRSTRAACAARLTACVAPQRAVAGLEEHTRGARAAGCAAAIGRGRGRRAGIRDTKHAPRDVAAGAVRSGGGRCRLIRDVGGADGQILARARGQVCLLVLRVQ